MLVIVSDLHMTDRDTGAPVTDTELEAFVREVGTLEPQNEKLKVLLLGDIIDFLRSEQWEELWKKENGATPWSGLGRDFEGFADSLQEQRLQTIAEGVEKRYSAFAKALKTLKKNRDTEIHYVAGNHDFMLQLSPLVRARIVNLLSLDEDPNKPFPLEYEDRALSVYAEHGNRYDKTNWHQARAGLWAIGDAIVLRVVNQFGALARAELHLTDRTPLGRAVQEIDNVEPDIHIPLYIAWLGQTKLVSGAERRKLVNCWRETVSSFLSLEEFREDRYGDLSTAIRWLRRLYQIADLDGMLGHLKKVPAEIGVNYALRAYLVKTEAQIRVFGHTHKPGVHALPEVGGQRRHYLNTGAWRRVITRLNVEGERLDFAGHRVATYLVIWKPGEFSLLSRCQIP